MTTDRCPICGRAVPTAGSDVRSEALPVSAVMAALAVCEVPTPTATEVLRVARAVRDGDAASDITARPSDADRE